jgi:probable HAF family extracellular repeat protein
MNDANQVVGSANLTGDLHHHAFFWNGGIGRSRHPRRRLAANRINNPGDIVGVSSITGDLAPTPSFATTVSERSRHPRWRRQRARDISSFAVVGSASAASGSSHAFYYADGSMSASTPHSTSGSNWTLLTAGGINDTASIVGTGISPGTTHAFLLTPSQSQAALVTMIALTAGSTLCRRRVLSPP